MPFIIEFNGTPEVASTEEYFLACLFTVVNSPSALTTRRFRAKLYVDDVEIPIKSASWNVADTNPAGSLDIELARLSDRTAFTRTAEIRLEAQEYLTGSWSTIKTYCDGSLLAASNYKLENNGNNPNDSFSVSVLPLLKQRLDQGPDQLVILYDSAKTTIDEDTLETVPNIDGTEGTVTLEDIADMTLGSVLEYVAKEIGYTNFKSNINHEVWPLTRVDFPAGQPYWNTIAGIIGNHEPKLSVDSEDHLVIRDGTLTDYITSRAMTLSHFKSVNLNRTIERFKGCHLTYQLKDRGWDYWEFNVRHKNQWFEGLVGQYPLVTTEIWEQVFYKNEFPNAPVDRRTLKEYFHTYADAFTLVAASGEVFSYTEGQILRRDKREFGLVKSPDSWTAYNSAFIPAPTAGFSASFGGPEESYTSASDATWGESLVLTRTERETFAYKAHPFQADSIYIADHDHWVKGIITIDSDNQQLGEDFEQPLARAQESGNISTGQGARWGTTDYKGESQTILADRKVLIRQRGNTPLNSSGLSYQDGEDVRVGDIEIQILKPTTKNVYITEGADSTATLWRSIHGGEAPLIVLQPLCIRLNKKQDYPGGIQAPLPTYDETMEIGNVISPNVDGRTSASLGIFEVVGYTDTFHEEGFLTEITARQIG